MGAAADPGAGTRTFVRGLAWTALFRLSGQAISWITTILVVRLLDPSDYGLMGMASLVVGFLAMLSDGGLGESLIQKEKIGERGISALFWWSTGIAVLLYAITAASAPFLASFFNEKNLTPVLLVAASGFILSGVGEVHGRLLLRDLRFRASGMADVTSNFAAGIVTLTLALGGAGVYSLAIGGITMFAVRTGMRFYFSRFKPRLVFTSDDLSGHLRFGGAVISDRVLWYAYANSDFLIAGKVLGARLYGLYSVAFTIASLPLVKVLGMVTAVLYPVLSRLQHDREQLNTTFLDAVRGISLLLMPALAGLALTAVEFTQVIFGGGRWSEAAFPLGCIAAASCVRVLGPLFNPLVASIGRPGVGVKGMAIALAVMLPAFLIGVQWGLNGLAMGWVIGYPIAFLGIATISLRTAGIPLRRYLAALGPALLTTASMSLVVLAAQFVAHRAGLDASETGSAALLLAIKVVVGMATVGALVLTRYRVQLRRVKSMFRGPTE